MQHRGLQAKGLDLSLFYFGSRAGVRCCKLAQESLLVFAVRLHRSEQYFTLAQSRCHFLRQLNSSLQVSQTLVGNSDFLIPLGKQKPQWRFSRAWRVETVNVR